MRCRWGVIGAGRIARQFVAQIPSSHSGTLVAVASSDRARALALAAETEGVAAYGDYAALIKAPDIDAVYIATLHPQHAGLIVACAEAGKHVLCEKPTRCGRRGITGPFGSCPRGTAWRPCAPSIAGASGLFVKLID